MPDSSMPPETAPAEGAPESGGVAEAITKLDGDLSSFIDMAHQVPDIPDQVKQKLGAALEAWRSAIADLTGGGGEEPMPEQGVSTPEQGTGGGAVPQSMGRRG